MGSSERFTVWYSYVLSTWHVIDMETNEIVYSSRHCLEARHVARARNISRYWDSSRAAKTFIVSIFIGAAIFVASFAIGCAIGMLIRAF